MGIEYLDKTHAKLVVTRGSGKNRERKVKRITYISKRDAKRQYDAFLASVKFGVDDKITVKELLDWYIEKFREAGGKETTAAGYTSAAKAIDKIIGKRRASELELRDIDAFTKRQKKSYSPKSIKNQLSLLNSAYKDAIRRGILFLNPCEYATIPRQVKPSIQILSDTDLNTFIGALSSADPDFRVMCELALFCGLRRSEILGLKHEDVSSTVTVNKVRHRVGDKDIIETPKTASSNRTLAVPVFIQEHVQDLISDHMTRPAESDYLIQDELGQPVTQWWVRNNLDNFILDNNLPHITMHGLRHTCASMLIAKGVPIADVSYFLGHSSIDITLRTYTHLFTDPTTASKHISDVMERIVAPNGHQNKKEVAGTQ